MSTQVINLPADLENFVKEAVTSGRFTSVDEVYRAALSSFRDETADKHYTEQDLIKAINEGIACFEGGRYIEFFNEGEFMDWSEGILVNILNEESNLQ